GRLGPGRIAAEPEPVEEIIRLCARLPLALSVVAARGAWIVFEDEAGQGLRPPKARTRARRGQTPVVSVSGGGSGRVSIAGLVCAKAGERTRMFYRTHVYHRRKGEAKGLSEHDYMQLLRAAHHQLGAPIVCVWDNDGRHTSETMRQFIEAHDWLTVYRLPP